GAVAAQQGRDAAARHGEVDAGHGEHRRGITAVALGQPGYGDGRRSDIRRGAGRRIGSRSLHGSGFSEAIEETGKIVRPLIWTGWGNLSITPRRYGLVRAFDAVGPGSSVGRAED